MNDHPNATVARRAYDAFSSGALDTLSELVAEDAVWHQPGHSRIAGEYVGRDQVFEFFGKLVDLSEGTFRAEPEDILADDERAVVIQHSTAARGGHTLDTQDVVVLELRGGKVAEARLFPADEPAEDTFWS